MESEIEIPNPLPPVICCNPRKVINPETVSLRRVFKERRKRKREPQQDIEKPIEPAPSHPLQLSFTPDQLFIDLYEDKVITKLRLWNPGNRTIYVQCSGLWDESARLGASWRCFPRIRYLLVPGLSDVLFIKAVPREFSPIPFAHIALQLAAGHLRDNVVGYFMIPICVKFLKYEPPPLMEEG